MRKAVIAVGVVVTMLLAWFVLSVTGVFARDITGRTWVLAASEHDGIRPPAGLRGDRPHFSFSNLKLDFYDGCNGGNAWALLMGGTMHVWNLSSTQMGCTDTTTIPAEAFGKRPELIHHGTWLELRQGDNRWAFEESSSPRRHERSHTVVPQSTVGL